MSEIKIFRSTLHASFTIEAGRGDININVLDETGTKETRFDVRREMKEDDAIRYLLGTHHHRANFLVECGLGPDTEIRTSVQHPITSGERGKLGDVDVLLVPKEQPHRALAVEAKLVRVIAKETKPGEPDADEHSKFPKLRHGAEQVLELLDLGFHRVVFLVFLLVDGSNRAQYNVLARSPTTESRRLVAGYASTAVNAGAGLCMIEVVQPGLKSFSKLSQVNVGMYSQPSLNEQRSRLTERVQSVMRNAEKYPRR
ncbi:MAG: hypothetical protein Q8O67_31910 [Deltaproteobacteria bacterium]|nr:hypothetical protein [Deltaproteobacteria bacterium]